MPRPVVELKCVWCCKLFFKDRREFARQVRERGDSINVFCSRACSMAYGHSLRTDLVKEITQTCPQCNKEFLTFTGKANKTHCSRQCASLSSVSDLRREAARAAGKRNGSGRNFTLENTAKGLRNREGYKYAELAEYLQAKQIERQFETPVAGYVFDLSLPSLMTLVEFDGPEHRDPRTVKADIAKAAAATKEGWKVVRVPVDRNAVIHPRALYSIC
jgi:very-short-patch-repair endonuclease